MAGVRIYCRGKIAAQTAVFNQKAGFTGKYDVRSYLVGELHADWLDERDDLILTDRRDILWSDDLCHAFEEWGQDVVRRIGAMTRDSVRRQKWEIFKNTGDVESRARAAYPTEEVDDIRTQAIELAKMFGQRVSREDAEKPEVVDDLVEISLTLAPHFKLTEMMKEAAVEADTPLTVLVQLMRTAQIAELASFGRIARDRIKVIERLKALKNDHTTTESELQELIAGAQWLINPEWAAVTANQSLSTLKNAFERCYKQVEGRDISLAPYAESRRRPDFVLSSQDGMAQIIEIKWPGHRLTDEEFERINSYHDNMRDFLNRPENSNFHTVFHDFRVTIVCDDVSDIGGVSNNALEGWIHARRANLMTWDSFLLRTSTVHEDFLNEAARLHTLYAQSEGSQ